MKLRLSSMLCPLLTIAALAQEEMQPTWELRLEHRASDYVGTNPNEGPGFNYAATDKEITIIDKETGKVHWNKAYKELAPNLRKIDELVPFWESNCIFLFDRKMGKDQIAVVDIKTGALLWTSEKYQNISEDNILYLKERDAFCISTKEQLNYVSARTGEEKWSTAKFKGTVGKYLIMPDGKVLLVNFVPDGLAALFTGFKNQIAKFNMDNGDIEWEAAYIGRAERKVLTGEFLFDLNADGDRVYLHLNGIQCYDYKTGTQLWSAAFDFTPDGIKGRPANAVKWGVYGGLADPVVVGEDLYVLDCVNRRKQFLKKYDRKSGKLLWTSPEIPDAKAIPGMYVVGDKVVLQIGGQVETQAYIRKVETGPNGTTTTIIRRIEWVNVKPMGLKAFNTSDGSLVWESERFKKGITNVFEENGTLFVCSGKALYSMDPNSGKENYEVPLGDDNIGDATMVMPYEDKVAVIGEKGVSTHNMNDGKLVNGSKYKSSRFRARFGDHVMMETEGDDIAVFDLATCKYRMYNNRSGATNVLSYNGQYVYVYDKKDVVKLKTY
jgi:outer membrane protein assembly factor BamB